MYRVVAVSVDVPTNISAPEFIGPVLTDDSFYFACRVIFDDSIEVDFDVALTFDGEILPEVPVKTVSSLSSLEANFTLEEFIAQFGKTVCYSTLTYVSTLQPSSSIHQF